MTTTAILALFASVSATYGLPPGLLSAECYVENQQRNPGAINHHDGGSPSVGLCQAKDSTARDMLRKFHKNIIGPINLTDPRVNSEVAAMYLKTKLTKYRDDVPCAVAAYNAGTCYTNEHGRIDNNDYVSKVFKAWLERR